MRENRTVPTEKEKQRMSQIAYIMEHWDDNALCKEGQVRA